MLNGITGRLHHVQHSSEKPSRLAAWSVGLAETAIVVLTLGFGLLLIGWAVGGSDAVEDTWIGATAAMSLYVSLATSLAGFGGAVIARLRHEVGHRLWLALAVFPGLALIVVIAEMFFLE